MRLHGYQTNITVLLRTYTYGELDLPPSPHPGEQNHQVHMPTKGAWPHAQHVSNVHMRTK